MFLLNWNMMQKSEHSHRCLAGWIFTNQTHTGAWYASEGRAPAPQRFSRVSLSSPNTLLPLLVTTQKGQCLEDKLLGRGTRCIWKAIKLKKMSAIASRAS